MSPPLEKISISQLAQEINQESVKKLIVSGNDILIEYQDGKQVESRKETEIAISESLTNYGVDQEKLKQLDLTIEEEKQGWMQTASIFVIILPLFLFGWFFWMITRQAKTGAMQAFNFSKTKARLFGAEGHPKLKISFKDVAGLKEAKEELKEIVEFLKTPKKFLDMGARIPRGVLLLGPPGCGKTLLARAVAGESNVPFFSIAGSEFIELFVGVGSGRVRSLFQEAKKHKKSIIFIDELDAIGRTRGTGMGGGHDEREQTLNQILVEMDGFERDSKTIIIAATNRPDILDPALLRPGRFDRRVVLDLPSIEDREAILKIHSKGKPLDSTVSLREAAERTPGFSGADLANLINEAAILAARRNRKTVSQKELLESIEKVLLGPERKSYVLSKNEKEVSAYHEAGHALVASFSDGGELVRKVSIVSRGMAAGYVLKSPRKEKRMKTKSEFLADIATFLGGYCAEEIKFGEVTTGASNDLKQASWLARKLVKEFGMSETLGPIVFGEKNELMFLGKEFGEDRNYSEKIAEKIDKEVEKIIKDAKKQAVKILKTKKRFLEKIAKTLIEKETIEKEELEKLLGRSKKKKRA
jgi:cell division protease FtsH